MANTIEVQTLVDGSRNLVVKVHIDGDGTGDESATTLIDASAYSPAFADAKLMKIQSNLVGFTAELLWNATTDKHAWQLPDYEQVQDFHYFGGIINDAGSGKNGDVNITTTGLGAGDSGHMILYFKKKTL